jgi:large subunit ribosomal protein L21
MGARWLAVARLGAGRAAGRDGQAVGIDRNPVVYRPAPRVYTIPFAQVSNMYAIVQAGGRQHKVTPGGYATLDGTAGAQGAELTLDQVLLVERDGGDVVAGSPFVANARVLAVVEGETRGPKVRVFKKKRRKGSRNTKGHRAVYTRVKIKDIVL